MSAFKQILSTQHGAVHRGTHSTTESKGGARRGHLQMRSQSICRAISQAPQGGESLPDVPVCRGMLAFFNHVARSFLVLFPCGGVLAVVLQPMY